MPGTQGADPILTEADERVLIVSNDSHVGPPPAEYRPYCPTKYLEDFDEYSEAMEKRGLAFLLTEGLPAGEAAGRALRERVLDTMVHYDVHRSLRHMNEEGVAVEVVFHGTMNGTAMPFVDPYPLGLSGRPAVEGPRGQELLAVGMRMYNRWLSDYCSVERGRHVGLAQIPMWDVDLAVREVEFAAEAGLGGLNFPAPRPGVADYNELTWEPLWSAAASLGLPLCTHGGASSLIRDVATYTGVNHSLCYTHEIVNFSRRALPFMIFGGVFERHPNLKLVFTEQTSHWVKSTLHDLDSLWAWPRMAHDPLPRIPSEYFSTNCYVGLSFMSNMEALAAVEQGTTDNMLWGRDYPHLEGTWPYTWLSLCVALQGVPTHAARQMLGLNAVGVYGLDLGALQTIAQRIGPTIHEITRPITPDELPESAEYTLAFRHGMSFA